MPEKFLTPRSKDTKNNLDHQENNEKSTNNKQTNSTSKSNISSNSMISSSAIAATSTNQKNVNSKEINNGSGTGKNFGIKKPSLKIKHREKLDTTLLRLLALLPNAAEPLDASNLLENSAKNGQKRPKRCSRVGQKTPDYSENH